MGRPRLPTKFFLNIVPTALVTRFPGPSHPGAIRPTRHRILGTCVGSLLTIFRCRRRTCVPLCKFASSCWVHRDPWCCLPHHNTQLLTTDTTRQHNGSNDHRWTDWTMTICCCPVPHLPQPHWRLVPNCSHAAESSSMSALKFPCTINKVQYDNLHTRSIIYKITSVDVHQTCRCKICEINSW